MPRIKKEFGDKEWHSFETMLKLNLNKEQIANVMQLSEDTIEKRIKEKYGKEHTFTDLKMKFSGELIVSARKMLYDKAKEGDTTAIIFLNKNLGAMEENQRRALELKKENNKIEKESKNAQIENIKLKNELLKKTIEKVEEHSNPDDILDLSDLEKILEVAQNES